MGSFFLSDTSLNILRQYHRIISTGVQLFSTNFVLPTT